MKAAAMVTIGAHSGDGGGGTILEAVAVLGATRLVLAMVLMVSGVAAVAVVMVALSIAAGNAVAVEPGVMGRRSMIATA